MKVEPILGFAGVANQAIDLYVKAFGATIKSKILFSQANPKDYQYADDEKDLVYYAEIKIGRQTIALGDDADAVKNGVQEVSENSFKVDLLIHFDSDYELKTAFELLSKGGTVTTPLCSQTYCSLTCALTDRFGGRWQLMSGYKG
ncbi:MAG: VOC family protein [Defluviitaleaceae bacterium]|nr:VOC family protein [Defluviitaleaceae bacterium]